MQINAPGILKATRVFQLQRSPWQRRSTLVPSCTFPSAPRARGFRVYSIFRDNQPHNNLEGQSIGTKRSSKRKEKSNRSSNAKSSLRRVAFEAEKSRGGLQKEAKQHPEIEHAQETKDVTAFCATETYNIRSVKKILESSGYVIDPSRTGLYPQVVHVQYQSWIGKQDLPRDSAQECGDIFIFPSGTVVAWNVDEDAANAFVTQTLRSAAENPHYERIETEDLEFFEDGSSEKSSVVDEKIRLGTKSPPAPGSANEPSQSDVKSATGQQYAANVVLAKIAFSSGLARSTKLAVLESALDSYFQSTRSIPTLLSRGTRLPYSRAFILRKTGELLIIRAQLNLSPGSSGEDQLTDSLPDLFWDSAHELGLENCFGQVARALDVGHRIRVLNEKMDYAQEIISVLRENLSEKHGLLLEWAIIGLICVEVLFEVLRLWRERRDRQDPESTESLLRKVLERELD